MHAILECPCYEHIIIREKLFPSISLNQRDIYSLKYSAKFLENVLKNEKKNIVMFANNV